MSPPPKFKDSPVEFDQHLLFPTNIFDLLPADHDCFVYETLFQNLDTSEVEKKYHHLGQHAYPPFGQIKNSVFRSFSLRGKEKVAAEFSLVCTAPVYGTKILKARNGKTGRV